MFEKSIDILNFIFYNGFMNGGNVMAKQVTKEKDKNLEAVLQEIEKQFGKGSIMK